MLFLSGVSFFSSTASGLCSEFCMFSGSPHTCMWWWPELLPIIITWSLSLCAHRSLRSEWRNTLKEISVNLLCGPAQYLPCLKLKSYSGWVVSLFLLFYFYLFMRLYLAIGCWHGWKVFSDWCFVCGMNKVIFRLVFCLWDEQSHLHNFVNRGMFACHCLQDFFTKALVMTTIIEWYEIKRQDLVNLRW